MLNVANNIDSMFMVVAISMVGSEELLAMISVRFFNLTYSTIYRLHRWFWKCFNLESEEYNTKCKSVY